jgi:hypothetical protein
MPGIVSFDYRFADRGSGRDLTTGTVDADATGTAQVTFTPPEGGSGAYTVAVTGYTAGGGPSDERSYWFTAN